MVRPNPQPPRPRLLDVLRAAEAKGDQSVGQTLIRLAQQAADEHRAQLGEQNADAQTEHEEVRR